MPSLTTKDLFQSLYFAKTEQDVDQIILAHPDIFQQSNWFPIDGNESNFGIIENQQSNPIAALVEKVTNSMDALLMKKCIEKGINPRSKEAPKSMDEAIRLFFPNFKDWDLTKFRKEQAEEIQVVADGPPRNTSVIIYDNGEGQHPADFERTFLSLVRGNKNDIMFVQGKYNMGGSGAIVFCGKKSYQLIGSKRFDGSGQFGFVLIREHPFGKGDEINKKNTWYEFLKINGEIPAFNSGDMDLKLNNRLFKTGTIIKMYSYQFPSGYSGFAQDLNQSFNEFLFDPVLPLLTLDKKERYPNNKILELDLYGLRRRLEGEKDYVENYFSEEYQDDDLFGRMKVTCYVFKSKVKDYNAKESKENIRDRYFKNNMSVLFSLNGQAHGAYTSEFITRTLKFNLLKDYLLIHVDCTQMNYNFRKELFMASRDRLKQGDEANFLREYLGKKLRKSQLDEINKKRKDTIGLDSEDTNELLKSFAKNLPKDSELFKLLQNTLKLEEKKGKPTQKPEPQKPKEPKTPFKPERFPSVFKLHHRKDGNMSVVSMPKGGEKTLKFDTDVEDHYFDRSEEPGSLEIALLDVKYNEAEGGDKPGAGKEIGDVLKIVKSSPHDGIIKLTLHPTEELQVGDEIQIKVSLTGPGEPREEIVWLKIREPEAPKDDKPKEEDNFDNLGLPKLEKVKKEDWDKLETAGITMNHDTVMFPVGEGNILEKIFINLDSNVYLNYRSKLKSEGQIEAAQKRYLASVYFHTLFLYMITKKRNYKMSLQKEGQEEAEVTVDEYIRDVFDSYYSDFLLSFGMEQLIETLHE